MKALAISKELSLPLDVATQRLAFLARAGAGKSYTAGKLFELMFEAKIQAIVLDPVGIFWGLRLAADGKGKGIDVPVLGGLHGDLPLEPAAGRIVAKLIVEKNVSAVLDVSMMRKGERKRFAQDFAEELFHLKKSNRSPLHLFVEEAQVFIPQFPQKGEEPMLGAFEDIVRQGRNFGFGVSLISQRPQSINKEALSQTECLFAFQTNEIQARKVIQQWIVDQGIDNAALVNSLPGLKVGECWLWSPSWLRLTKQIHISKKRTFDASATPKAGDRGKAPAALAQLDLKELEAAMAAVVAKVKEDDPKALHAKIAELQRELASKKPSPPAAPQIVERYVAPDLKYLKKVTEMAADQMRQLMSTQGEVVIANADARGRAAAQEPPYGNPQIDPRSEQRA